MEMLPALQQALDLITTAAIIVSDDGTVTWKNHAANPLGFILDRGAECVVSNFLELMAPWNYKKNYRVNVTIQGEEWVMTAARVGAVNLILFTPEEEDDETVQTMLLSMYHGLESVATDLIYALREVAIDLEEINDPVLDNKLAGATRACYRLVRSATDMAELGRYFGDGNRCMPLKTPIRAFLERLAEKEKDILTFAQIPLKVEIACKETLVGNIDHSIAEKIVANLLSNAIKYGSSDTPITLRLAAPDDSTVTITVSDRGKGIDGDTLSTVFSRYLQDVEEGDPRAGSGMGLAMVRELAMQHGGTAMVRTDPDGAAVIASLNLTLPPVLSAKAPHIAAARKFDTSLVELSDVLPPQMFLSYAVED